MVFGTISEFKHQRREDVKIRLLVAQDRSVLIAELDTCLQAEMFVDGGRDGGIGVDPVSVDFLEIQEKNLLMSEIG
jgi:hypothetical protein